MYFTNFKGEIQFVQVFSQSIVDLILVENVWIHIIWWQILIFMH